MTVQFGTRAIRSCLVALTLICSGACVAPGAPSASTAAGSTAQSPAATPTSSPTLSASPTPSSRPSPSPSPSPTPSGPGMRWIAGQDMPEVGAEASLLGWKWGFLYAGLEWPDGWDKSALIHVWASADGLTWSEAASIRSLREVDGLSLVEGPKGAILAGWQGGCNTITGLGEMWLSANGSAWSELPLPFGKTSLVSMSGGPSGYIATGRDGSTPVVWDW